MADDGSHRQIHIPSYLIYKKDGERLKQAMIENSN